MRFSCSCVLPAFHYIAWPRSLKLDIHHVAKQRQTLAPPPYRPWARCKEQIEFGEIARISNAKSRPVVRDTENETICAYCTSVEDADGGPWRIEPNLLPSIDLESGKAYRSRPLIVRTKDY